MSSSNTSRRLATIVVCDVVGFTRLVGRNEAATLEALRSLRSELIDPLVAEYGGRIANTAGDSIVAEFPSAGGAVAFARQLQGRLTAETTNDNDSDRLRFCVGINLGDVHDFDGDILGDGVNIAARLQALAPPEGICVSETVKNVLTTDKTIHFEDLGPQRLKNVDKPVNAYLVSPENIHPPARQSEYTLADQSRVRYVPSKDGTNIAYTSVGQGYPLVFGACWLEHLEKDWDNPGWSHYVRELAKNFSVIRYDQRGSGMSDWNDVDITFEKMVDDLECVVDCYDFEKVALFGASQAASIAISYITRRPEKVSHLVLHGGYARGRCRRGDPEAEAESQALVTLIRQGWNAENPAFRQMVTSMFMPDASQEEANWFNEFQKECGPAENIARYRELFDDMDVSGLLTEVKIPTLVIHCSGDSVSPLAEGKFIAGRIPSAQVVTLNSNNQNEPGFHKLVDTIGEFVA